MAYTYGYEEQPMTLSALAGGMENDPMWQQYLMDAEAAKIADEQRRLEEERKRMQPNTSVEWAGGAVPMRNALGTETIAQVLPPGFQGYGRWANPAEKAREEAAAARASGVQPPPAGQEELMKQYLSDLMQPQYVQQKSYDHAGRVIGVSSVEDKQATQASRAAAIKLLSDQQKREEDQRARLKGQWQALEADGRMWERNTITGELRPLMAEGQQLAGKRPSGASIEAMQAMTEAKAKIPGTAEYKRAEEMRMKQEKAQQAMTATQRYAQENADMLERSLADILGVKPEDLPRVLGSDTRAAEKRVSPSVGSIDVRLPTILPNTQNIDSAIENLKSKAQMFGLMNLRKAGVAPGSITEKEWPKFESTLANIDPRLSEAAFVKQLQDIYRQVQGAREGGRLDAEALGGQPAPQNIDKAQAIFEARKVLSTGRKDPAMVRQRLMDMGIDPREAGL